MSIIFLMIKGFNRICRKRYITGLYENRYGIKVINPIEKIDIAKDTSVIFVKSNELFLDMDWLKDDYTLCDTPLIESPHLDLMRRLEYGESIEECEYCKRIANGSLDTRRKAIINSKYIHELESIYREKRKDFQNNKLEPVVIYEINNRKYIADGKHRASLYALLSDSVPCVLAKRLYLADSAYLWKYRYMNKNSKRYRINIEFYEKCLKESDAYNL